ncbi:hypothetical protein [Pontibacter sp. SGAir0037]|uniref:hypothetical protein n=1 Tax=Pontibacter sp. SGAir0037 TaxID=2571030 RepID=UPI0010CD18A5|nr:hypothetical protein [Pontibacter sp. SGAir0037]QCR24488.1 hypothetical protein C1N53_20425 [Pontibacter sp. SGAir0037]
MTPAELEERVADAERVLALHGKRLEKLEHPAETARPGQEPEQQAPAAPDISRQLEELKALLGRHDLSLQALQIYAQINSFRDTISKLPKVLPVRHHHHFEDRSRGFIIGAIACLLAAAISAGLCFGLYRENGRLKVNEAKYRALQQAYPEAVQWVDSTYHRHP